MTLAPRIPRDFAAEFGEGVHADRTARLQVANEHSTLGRILSRFEEKTSRRVLINTSLNRRGEPIAQFREDAFGALEELGIDALVLGSELVEKRTPHNSRYGMVASGLPC